MRAGTAAAAFALLAVGCVKEDAPARAPSRGAVIGGERVPRLVVWPRDDAIHQDTADALPTAIRTAVDRSPLPVLLPRGVDLEDAQLVVTKEWFALWIPEDEVTITLGASGTARIHEHVRARAEPGPTVTQNEGIWSRTWIEHGVAYDLGVECADPAVGPCQDDRFIRALDLVFVGPTEAQR